jgi:hypothetical protein
MGWVVLAAAHAGKQDPDGDSAAVWDWIENHGTIVYPAIVLLVIGLIAAAMVSNARQNEISAERRGQLKMQIMGVMRRRISGISGEHVASDLGIDLMLAVQLLSELASEGLIAVAGGEDGKDIRYRLRGK